MRKSINKLAGVFSFLILHAFFLCISLSSEALAEGSVPAVPGAPAAPAAPAATPAQPSIVEMVMPFLLMFGVMYFLIIRPQQKKVREQQEMLSALAVGNEVVTTSGIFGVVKELGDKVVTLEVADRVSMRFVRSQIAQKISSESKS